MLSTFRAVHGLPGFKIAANGAWTLTAGDRVVASGVGARVVVDAAATGGRHVHAHLGRPGGNRKRGAREAP